MNSTFCRFLFLMTVVNSFSALPAQANVAQNFQTPQAAGGMWMLEQMPAHAECLRDLGCRIDPVELADPSSQLMKAIVSLGGCSGAFVSANGLIFTNHHCVQGILSYLSNVDRESGHKADYTTTGFMARERSEERAASASERIFITQKFEDVTEQILNEIELITDPLVRYQEVERRRLAIVAKSENGRSHIRARVAEYFNGAKYYLIEQLELRDVRLVFAPPHGIGTFGGDDDNWQWPRHTGDFAVLRAYVAPDGKPAGYAAENVPFHPEHHLPMAKESVKPGDFVLAAGYPGSTSRLNTADQVRYETEHYMPQTIEVISKFIAELDHLGTTSEALRLKVESQRKGLMNSLQNRQESLKSLQEIKILEQKMQFEDGLAHWIASDPQRQSRFGTVLTEMAQLRNAYRILTQHRAPFYYAIYGARLLNNAIDIVKRAEERMKADVDREAGYQDRDLERALQAQEMSQVSYAREVDIHMFTSMAETFMPGSALLSSLFANDKTPLRAQLEKLYTETTLESVSERQRLVKEATLEFLRASTDPLLQLAIKIQAIKKQYQEDGERFAGQIMLLIPRYIQALREYSQTPIAPDANSSLRVTYGQVKGYAPQGDNTGFFHHPFTNLTQMLAKAVARDRKYPYTVPDELLEAVQQQRFGSYTEPMFGDVPVNFLTNLDITGGNSGTAVQNRDGHLVGLLFDGTAQSMYNDWIFSQNSRSIAVDVRYILWVLEHVYGMHNIISELNSTAYHKFSEQSCSSLWHH